MRDGASCRAAEAAGAELQRPLSRPPFGACMLPIVQGYLEFIQPDMQVLDIGCGSWPRIRNHCQAIGASYEGIDVEASYFDVPSVATRLENLADLSYADNSFDLVIANQSMEHWGEFGCSLRWGLYQCFRVCKVGGRICLNVPIYYHGTSEFMLGRVGRLLKQFLHFSEEVRLEKWGHPSEPIQPVFAVPGYWRLSDKPAHILDIQLIKTREVQQEKKPRYTPTGRLAQILRYPFSYNVHRVLQKLKPGRSS